MKAQKFRLWERYASSTIVVHQFLSDLRCKRDVSLALVTSPMRERYSSTTTNTAVHSCTAWRFIVTKMAADEVEAHTNTGVKSGLGNSYCKLIFDEILKCNNYWDICNRKIYDCNPLAIFNSFSGIINCFQKSSFQFVCRCHNFFYRCSMTK